MTDIYAAYAHEYRKKGYSPVPLPAGRKAPTPIGWTGIIAPMASGPDVQAWCETDPEGNIALRLPDGVVGIDVDDYGDKPGWQTFMAAYQSIGVKPPSAGKLTARGADGKAGIRLFRVPAGTELVGNFASAGFGPDVDIIQHKHRYCLGPGSIHPEGGTYTWYNLDGSVGELPAVADLPELPQEWIDALTPRARELKSDIPHEAYDAMPAAQKERVDAYVAKAVAAIMADLEEMKSWEKDYRHPVKGYGWEVGTLELTASLASLVLADWTGLDLEAVRSEVEDHMPHGGGLTLGAGMSKFARAIDGERVDARPFPPELDTKAEDELWDRLMAKATLVDFRQAGGGEAEPSAEEVTVEENPDDWPEEPWNEKGDAARTKRWANGGLKWLADEEVWVRWAPDEHRWVKDPRAGARACQKALEVAEHTEILNYDDTPKMDEKTGTPKPKSSQRDKFLHEIRNRWGIGQFERVSKSLALSGDLDAESKEFDADGMLLAVKGGAVDLRTLEFIEGKPEMKITVGSDVVFDPTAKAPMFEKYLETSMPEPAMREYLQRIMGYSLIGGNPEQAFFIHWGPQTNNGKSVLMNVFRKIMGSQMRAASSKALIKSRNDKHSVEIADLYGPRVLQMGETAEGAALEEETIKAVTGDDVIAARKLNQGNRDWVIDGKIHILTNYLPHISASPSMKRRTHLVVWPVEVAGDKVILDLDDKIIASEISGVLNWLLEGCQRWREQLDATPEKGERKTGLARPAQAVMDVEKYFFEEDTLAEWLFERVNDEVEEPLSKSSVLYEDYKMWCWPRNVKAMSSNAFGRKLREKRFDQTRRKDGVYYPIALKPAVQQAGYFS